MSAAELLPAESIALTVGLAQVQRGEAPEGNVAAMCVLALARLAGRHDWTEDVEPAEQRGLNDAPITYGLCLHCQSIEVALNKPTGTRDLSSIGESDTYPTGYGCELCA